MQNGEISLAEVKNNQERFKSNLSEVKKAHRGRTKEQEKKTLCTILKCFTKQETRLLNFIMIALQ